jgi:sulfite reductase (NADPH) flavoprotein alpha-component
MSLVPIIPESAPFTAEQRAWLNGFLAGALNRAPGPVGVGSEKTKIPLTIAFGSQSGNAESLAKRLAKEAASRGFAAGVAGLDSLQASELSKHSNLLIITSTWGEGEMPDNAVSFWEQLNQNGSSPDLRGVNYGVLALGDLNYGDTFCLAGKMMDQRLEALGATRVLERVDCDVDFDKLAAEWAGKAWQVFVSEGSQSGEGAKQVQAEPVIEAPIGSKKNPYEAALVANVKLNTDGSAKDTRHLAFSLGESGLSYEPGDALGVFARNGPLMVDGIIAAHRLSASAVVPLPDGGEAPLREALINHYECRKLHGVTPDGPVDLKVWLEGLRKLQPRLYSIASSQRAHPTEVHLCVAAVRYDQDGVKHEGVASTFMADRLDLGETTGIFFQAAKHFRLPESGDLPIIMVGPGTGIAPFRAFLEEREAAGSRGKNWLFYGDQRSKTDFLYQSQIEQWQTLGLLTELDLAFSRDQERKIYVQQRMIEKGALLWQWLEEGAHFYVCGDASRMAKDVDAALHEVVRVHGARSEEEAAAYIADLKKAKRYARDVY